jgi:hypothetical protein
MRWTSSARLFASGDERDVAAFGGEGAGDGVADAAGGAGDEGGFAYELEVHVGKVTGVRCQGSG